jgi:hypothetical protein
MANTRLHSIDDITHEIIVAAFDYDPTSGTMVWRPRSPEDCKSPSECKRWNSSYAGKDVGSIGQCGYRKTKFRGRYFLVHQLVWFLVNGSFPTHEIDHINGNPLDNRLKNLREVTSSQNNRNKRRPSHNTSGVIGVAPARSKGKWVAHIMGNDGENIYLGTFPSVEMAAVARRAAEKVAGYHTNHGRRAA